jgi:flagellar basal-body rod protein FlgC
LRAVEISRSALNVEWQRLQVIAQNLANLNTTRTANGEPFRPMRLLSGPDTDFAAMMARGGQAARDVGGVRVMGMEASGGNLRRVMSPATRTPTRKASSATPTSITRAR